MLQAFTGKVLVIVFVLVGSMDVLSVFICYMY